MKIATGTWHYRVYDYWFRQKHKGDSVKQYVKQRKEWYGPAWRETKLFNLCSYVRVILFWGPARFLFSRPRIWFTLSAMLLTLLGTLYHFRGWHGLVHFFQVVLCLGATVTVILGTGWCAEKIRDYYKGHRNDALENFTEILKEQWKAAHDGVCPTIEFKD